MTPLRRRIFVIGSANMDLVLRVVRFPSAGETLIGSDLELHTGGKGANQACAAARLGGDVHFTGCVGSDPFGARLVENLQSAGVDTSGVRIVERPTGCASIYVTPDGENAIVISPGANAEVNDADVQRALAHLTREDLVLLQLEIPLEAVRAALKLARAVSATTILDPAPARVLDSDFLRLVNILTPNQTESVLLLNPMSQDMQHSFDPAQAAAKLLEHGVQSVILKLGDAGCAVCSGDSYNAIEGFSVKAVDTTAAGDVFNGALAVALSEGREMKEAARFANAAAAISVTRAGAQTSIPNRAEVDSFLRERQAPGVQEKSW